MGTPRPDKAEDLDGLRRLGERARSSGLRTALCHGCFDLLHVGHVHHFHEAAALADLLVVSVSADAACVKGPGRPLYGVADRTGLIAALEAVDHVHAAEDSSPMRVIEALRPDVYVKGPDYARNPCVRLRAESALVERLGGRTVFTDEAVTASSTALLRRLHA
ncbi:MULTISPECIES: adenylyltransferase/cytidyltransferase family protein [Nocardiopsidaceae]|uniref:Adenylyltransferase/cytidyltransferase family protein n=2 Tax=Nocardiopsidaceae TaxID=83676 RepID=A0ABY6YF27_9ACTN|nr:MULTISPECIES: adenylyltransferase/cytidyltransferase family protein [Nocardiopsaceae]MEE2047515.1 adenylyltransferase/cytidyltransferase family protein [Nocardiopsis tropica]MEE2055173.1 adenylyltransferase/cytidyltransferase family protein [Nocardiopsis umidischolae]WAE70853.1 adenylyltransferase/cytidyltransferase family protein [Streptomonospora nanhaiensis]